MYHGTTKENADSILKTGFRVGTYFTGFIDSALMFGGDYIFAVFFEKNLSEYWEWCNSKVIPPSKIIRLCAIHPEIVYTSEEMERAHHRLGKNEWHKKNGLSPPVFCENCDGHGCMEKYSTYHRWRDINKITICKKCNGHGILNPYEEIKSNGK